MNIKFNLYKPSGKWYGEGIASIPDTTNIYDANLLEVVAAGQDEIFEDAVKGGYFHVVLTPVNDDLFFDIMIPANQ